MNSTLRLFIGKFGFIICSILAFTIIILCAYKFAQITNSILFPDILYSKISFGEDKADKLTITQIDMAQCRDDSGFPANTHWIVLQVKNPNIDKYGFGSGSVTFFQGVSLVGGFYLEKKPIPANSEFWLVDPDMLDNRYALALDDTYNNVSLEFGHTIAWFPVDGSEDLYEWSSLFIDHQMTSGQYPKHSLTIEISNNGNAVMYRTRVFALVYNHNDQLVDILWSENPGSWAAGITLRPHRNRTVELNSIAKTGRCLGLVDTNYSVKYWVDFLTSSGQPMIGSNTIILP